LTVHARCEQAAPVRARLAAAASLALALAACGSDPEPPPAAGGWRDVPGMICADGSQTGIGILPGSADAVLVYLSGGGACWGDTPEECDASFRSFGEAEFDLGARFFVAGTLLDRTLPGNPFATWTVVFVPYCTGDVHAGDSVQTHGGVGWSHHGYANLQAAVARMAAELAPPAQVVVAGSSAGGFGALLAHDLVRAEWRADAGVEGALVDDSGPTFVGSAIPDAVRGAWWDAWQLSSTVGAHCPACEAGRDLSEIWPTLRAAHPADRLALVSTTQDLTMRGFFGGSLGPLSGSAFETALDALTTRIDGPGTAVFRVGGANQTDHALLFSVELASYTSGDGTPLLGWLSDMAAGRAWTSKGPGP
jgi:hypothetical protein